VLSSNSYFVSLRTDAVAAIRAASERLNVELGVLGHRRLQLWELVEGGCTVLSTRFAEFAGHVLVQARSSTGVSALYVSAQAVQVNAIQARIALERLTLLAGLYASRVPAPTYDDPGLGREALLDAGAEIQDIDVGAALRGPAVGIPVHSGFNALQKEVHPSGWGWEGGRRA